MAPTYYRFDVVSFTIDTFNNPLVFVTLKPNTKSYKWIFSSAFSEFIWIGIFIGYIVLSISLIIFFKILKIKLLNFVKLLEIICALFLKQCKLLQTF